MIALLLVVCLAIVILFNPKEEEEVSPGCNAAAWLLAIVGFVILLGAVSVVGAGLAALAVVP